ncbi:bacteriocin biosynthesis protein [Bacillus stercoris]|uniref:Bacteriocin biosynthesis protein n=1 Tax=Bacillus stercoris TaxID=2054641 RepID=A0ABU0V5P5_9BACI|nr:bacteriocin biosynthesis protein [Bacillus stercoris]MDQ1852255.1 bacteriocin biosynthesis protein [Bacillus stercoris]
MKLPVQQAYSAYGDKVLQKGHSLSTMPFLSKLQFLTKIYLLNIHTQSFFI